MAPIVHTINSDINNMQATIIITSQHKKMLNQVLNLFRLKPSYDLNIMKHDQDLFDISMNILGGIKSVLKKVSPDIVLVQGDTSTTFLSALAAYYLKIKVGHVEAGLRTNNRYSPFPEEMNRRMVTCLSDYHFAPTAIAKQNLINEYIPDSKIIITGNTAIDALFWVLNYSLPIIRTTLEKKYAWLNKNKKSILVTTHRRENFGTPLRNILDAIKIIHDNNPDVTFTFPVHMNPNIKATVYDHLNKLSRVHLIDPVSYEEFVYLIERSHLVLTDSGGIQEEAPSLGKPVLVLRDTTERPEGIMAGTNLLVGTNKEKIVVTTENLLRNTYEYRKMSEIKNPYGEGDAALKIVSWLQQQL